jgi:hypothetical protein
MRPAALMIDRADDGPDQALWMNRCAERHRVAGLVFARLAFDRLGAVDAIHRTTHAIASTIKPSGNIATDHRAARRHRTVSKRGRR